MKSWRFLLVGMLFMVAVLLVACGEESAEPEESDDTTVETVATEGESEETAEADSEKGEIMTRIEETGVLRVGFA